MGSAVFEMNHVCIDPCDDCRSSYPWRGEGCRSVFCNVGVWVCACCVLLRFRYKAARSRPLRTSFSLRWNRRTLSATWWCSWREKCRSPRALAVLSTSVGQVVDPTPRLKWLGNSWDSLPTTSPALSLRYEYLHSAAMVAADCRYTSTAV